MSADPQLVLVELVNKAFERGVSPLYVFEQLELLGDFELTAALGTLTALEQMTRSAWNARQLTLAETMAAGRALDAASDQVLAERAHQAETDG